MELSALEIAAAMTYPENLTLSVLREKLDSFGMESEKLTHAECVRLFYTNLAALPCRHVSTTTAQVDKTTFTTFNNTTKTSSKPTTKTNTLQSTTTSTPEMDRLLSRSKAIKTKPATPNPPTACDAPKAKVIKLIPKTTNVEPKTVERSSEPKTADVTPTEEPKTKQRKIEEAKTEESIDESEAKQKKINPTSVVSITSSPCKQQEVTAASKKPRKLQRNFFPTAQKSG